MFLNRYNANRDIFHDLMSFKVKEILLVATLYDAYTLEKEGRFTESILGEYYQLNLTSVPRITGVTTFEEAKKQLKSKHFDLIIIMVGNDKNKPAVVSKKLKNIFPYIPIYLLLNNNMEIDYFRDKLISIDRIFVWNGDSTVFFAMVKLLEDKVNIENDTKIGYVKVILLVEDSEKYYSRYLPILYSSVMEQTQRLIEDVSTDDLYKVLRLRARPKILLATDYEDAIEIFNNYSDNMLCLISDVKFKKNGKLDEKAGFSLVNYARSIYRDLPIIIQSSDPENAVAASELKSIFINKNSDYLIQNIKSFIERYLGFGNFIYKDANGAKIAVARNLKEFEDLIGKIPAESLLYHGKRNHFSLWLMARGEIKIAKMINPVSITDFKTIDEFRHFMNYVIKTYRNEENIGKVINFEKREILEETNVVSLGDGALGGKGRGLAFVNTLIYNFNFSELIPKINIRTPATLIIGTHEFDFFMEINHLKEKVYKENDYDKIKNLFLDGEFSYDLTKKLKVLVETMKDPIAVRSSSLFEDSTMQPFSGIYSTFMLPNNHTDIKVRYKQICDAIKLVYASMFSSSARLYFEAVNYKIEEEKMAVVIQEVVGNKYDSCYYPHISGTAQSHNFYPVSHMKPEDGFAVSAVGLGKYVVEGDKTYRYSPKFPKLDIISPKDLLKSTQVDLYAVNMANQDINLLKDGEEAGLKKIDLIEAEKHGTLNHCVSVYNIDNDTTEPGLDTYGPRIVNFADILKYDYIPLADTIDVLLDVVKEALGCDCEIEYAVDLNKTENNLPSFYLLQIKPLIGNEGDYAINLDKIKKEKVILFAEKSMGNGKLDDIQDVIFVDNHKFDKMKTQEMADEIDLLNKKMVKEKKKYILIGPGRWGSRDRFIGIPVIWTNISNAKVIVELSIKDFPLDASLGSHFFHNVTSMNVGYFSISHSSATEFIDWSVLNKQKVIETTKFFKHIRFEKPISVVMDGKKRISMIKFE
ncbi:MAG: pyruvate, phosphate dikinase [Bacteroidetes bacterium]|nr:pyruvate, phosphate dikinase [Bacteroidota bacterium]